MNTSTEHQAYGTFTGGGFTQTAQPKATRCRDDRWAATSDSTLDVRACGATPAYTSTFIAGTLTTSAVTLHPNPAFTLVAGGL